MDVSQIAKTTQEQAVASWVDRLNQLRLDELLMRLAEQDINLEGALVELQQLKDFVANPEYILGSIYSKHGEIAEHVHVNISNARHIIEGLSPEYTFESIGRTAPEDYLFNGIKVQSKYLNSLVNTLTNANGVVGHLSKYPDFLTEGNIYHIPKDQYEAMQKLLAMSDEEVNKASREVRAIIQKLNDFQQQTGIDLSSNKIQPAVGKYSEVQLGKIDETIEKEESTIKETDKKQRDEAHQQSKPTLQEGLKATGVSAAVEGGMSFCLAVAKKLRAGKKLNEFTEEDWKEVGIDTAGGTGKGAIRGASIYGLTNFTATPAAVASAMVTATFGVAAQANLLRQNKITGEEFIENSEVVCLDVTISAIASVIGQVAIPVPVLGAVIGNAVGMFMYGIAKDNLSKHEQQLISKFNNDINSLNAQLNEQYKALIELLKREFAKFRSVVALAFDFDVNIAFTGSVELAQYVGCDNSKILKNKAEVDSYFQK